MNTLVFEGKTYTYQMEEVGKNFTYDYLVVRDEDGNRVDTPHYDKVRLDNVEVGDWVVVVKPSRKHRTEVRSLYRVERTTKTQLTVDGVRYMKSTGDPVGSQSCWCRGQSTSVEAYNPTDEIQNLAWMLHGMEQARKDEAIRLLKEQTRMAFNEFMSRATDDEIEALREYLTTSEVWRRNNN